MVQAIDRKGKFCAAVTGMGCISAAGTGVDETWQALEAGKVNCAKVPAWMFNSVLSYPVFFSSVDALSATGKTLLAETFPDFRPEAVSRTVHLAFSAVSEALVQAGIDIGSLRGRRVGVAVGTTVGCTFHKEEYFTAWRRGEKPDLDPIYYFINSNIAAAIHTMLGTCGPAAVINTACASGTDAIGVAKGWLEAGLCDVAIAGGADELSRVAYNGFASLMLNDTDPCRPFDQSRRGLNIGEGAGVMVIESEDDALARGGTPIGWLRGYGAASDAYHPTAPHPQGRGLLAALQTAMQEARVSPDDISLVNAHGTGTPANDRAETGALATLFSAADAAVAVTSTKGITGHTLGAAGGIEAILALQALRLGYTPGTVGCSSVDPAFPLRPLSQGETAELHSRTGISESLAFGGSNAVLVLEASG